MTFWINFFNKVCLILLIAWTVGAVQSASATGPVPQPVARKAAAVTADVVRVVDSEGRARLQDSKRYGLRSVNDTERPPLPEPLVAATTAVVWAVHDLAVASDDNWFEIEKDGELLETFSTGNQLTLEWTPSSAGGYRARLLLLDESGNRVIGPWSEKLIVTAALEVDMPFPSVASPQQAHSRPISWSVSASGGAGELHYRFQLEKSMRHLATIHTAEEASWTWYPNSPGDYRVRVTVTDRQGNQAQSPWSRPFRIEPPLEVVLQAGLPVPGQAAVGNQIALNLSLSGGVPPLTSQLLIEKDGGLHEARTLQGLQAVTWTPDSVGTYRLGLLVTDALNNQAVSPWSEMITINPALQVKAPIADRSMPQVAEFDKVTWTATATGGAGELKFTFFYRKGDVAETRLDGNGGTTFVWSPAEAGEYQFKVSVSDRSGSQVESDWSDPFRILPPLQVTLLGGTLERDQFEVGTSLYWTAASTGGIGDITYQFQLQREDATPLLIQSGEKASLEWTPQGAGSYRMRVVAEDSIGHRRESRWSEAFDIVARLEIGAVIASPKAPFKALSGPVLLKVQRFGGVGAVEYIFSLVKNDNVVVEYVGSEPEWVWHPSKPGVYQVEVTAVDETGRSFVSRLSSEYRVIPAIDRTDRLIVFPVENLSGVKAPLTLIREMFSEAVENEGVELLQEATLEAFMREIRLRYTGGIGIQTSQALKSETGADAVLILNVETYQESGPPKVSLIARLVICNEQPAIAWMDSVGLSGDESPGMLGLSLIESDHELIAKAIERLARSFIDYLDSKVRLSAVGVREDNREEGTEPSRGGGRYQPRSYFRSDSLDVKTVQTVAVLPFANRYARKNSGRVLPLHLVRDLLRYENLNIIEPGVVRDALLKYRIVMEGGPSFAVADTLASQRVLNADLTIAGNVLAYQGLRGEPKVQFSVQAVNTKNREIVWWSNSYAAGNDNVLFFDVDRIFSAHGLAERMSKSVVRLFVEGVE